MRFDPLSRDIGYDPEVMAAQSGLEEAARGNDLTFSEGFTFSDVVTGEKGFGEWATSGLSGLFLSGVASEDAQNEWFVQRHAIDFGYKELDNLIEAYRKIGETRDFTQEEAETIREMMARKDLIEEDLEFVYDNFDGDLDAVIDDKGKSFNGRWGDGQSAKGLPSSLDMLLFR